MSSEVTFSPQVDEQPLGNVLETNKPNNRVAEFWAFVAENSDVIVESPRLPGVEMAFGALMAMCAATVTEQNVDKFYAESQILLANAKSNAVELEEEGEYADAGDLEADEAQKEEAVQGAEIKDRAEESDTEVKNERSETKEPVQQAEKDNSPKDGNSRPPQLNSLVVENKSASYSLSSQAKPSPSGNVEALRLMQTNLKTSLPTAIPEESATANNIQQTKEIPQTTIKAAINEESIFTAANEEDPASNKVEMTTQEVRVGQAPTDSLVEITGEMTVNLPENKELLLLPIEPETRNIELTEGNKPIFALLAEDYLDKDNLLVDDRLLPKSINVDRTSDLDPGKDPILPSEETPTFTNMEYEPKRSDIVLEFDLPIEEVEEVVTLVAQRVEELDDKRSKEVYELLDQITQNAGAVSRLAKNNFGGSEMDSKTEGMQEELKELFIQLFDQLEIEYTAELVESFVNLILKDDLSEFIPNKRNEEISAPKDRGTHEVIKQLLVGVSILKRSIIYAYHLGRSAIHLYSQAIASTLEILAPAKLKV